MLQQAVLIFIFSGVFNFEHWSFNISCSTPKVQACFVSFVMLINLFQKNYHLCGLIILFITHFVIRNSTNIKQFHCLLDMRIPVLLKKIKILTLISVFYLFVCFFFCSMRSHYKHLQVKFKKYQTK